MSVLERIKSELGKGVDRVVGVFRPKTPLLDLTTEFTRYFLADAIELRAENAASPSGTSEAVRSGIAAKYKEKLDEEIKQELLNPQLRAEIRALLEKYLADTKLSSALSENVQSSKGLTESLVIPWQFKPRWKKQFEIEVFLGLVLRAVQQVALNIIRIEYPLTLPPKRVPDDVQAAIRRILLRVEKVSRLFPTALQIKSAQNAETELRVLVARNSGFACLPLRPIASSPLSRDDFSNPWAGQPNEVMLRLSRQIRQADGSILVTGYRGVGKSSFVNRVIYEALGAQDTFPDDEWLLVPVTVNLAKVSGVQNILRLTLRAVREALLETDSSDPKPIPSRGAAPTKPIPLPLKEEAEIELLHEAYIRATYKVTMGASTISENAREFSSAFSFDPGKLIPLPFQGLELGKFLAVGIKKTKVEKISRELNLLDYDENAAEDDLGRLIRSLAQPRPLSSKDSRQVRIKLVFVFDELDKMDVETGLKPMIEGLKNLFLHQHAVFILVTSKKFYYDLLKDRAIEDAMLNSYFSAIVNVPLLQFSQARDLVNNWVFWESTDQLKTASRNELKLIEQLTRVLVYRSFGNPRDMIRELRLMQEWADTQQPYLTDQGKNSTALQVFAAIQDCVEKTASHSSSTATVSGAAAPLVSDRLVGDESRLEQIRRGLYILVEELINRQKLIVTTPHSSINGTGATTLPASTTTATTAPTATPVSDSAAVEEQHDSVLKERAVESTTTADVKAAVLPAKTDITSESDKTFSEALQELARLIRPKPAADLSVLEKIHKDNFSLVSLEDVQALAKRLGDFLDGLHRVLFPDNPKPEPLITFRNETLNVEQLFYDLTGRQALSSTGTGRTAPVRKMAPAEAIADAKTWVQSSTWPEKMSALLFIRELEPEQVPPELQKFLIDVTQNAPSSNDRVAAAQLINPSFLFSDTTRNLTDLLANTTDDRVLSVYMNRLREADNDNDKSRATAAISHLLTQDIERPISRRMTDDSANTAFTVLPLVCPGIVKPGEQPGEVTRQVLRWLSIVYASEALRRTALTALTAIAAKENVDLVDCILGSELFAGTFVSGRTMGEMILAPPNEQPEMKMFFRALLRAQPLLNASKLLEASTVDVDESDELLVDLYTAALDSRDPNLTTHIIEEFQKQRDEKSLGKLKLRTALAQMPEFSARLQPLIEDRLASLVADGTFTEVTKKDLRLELELVTKLAEPKTAASPILDQALLNRFIRQRVTGLKTVPPYGPVPPPVLPSRITFKRSSPWTGSRLLAVLLVTLVGLVPGFLFYQGDLPGTTFGIKLASRFILFLLDAAIVLPIVVLYQQTTEDFQRQMAAKRLINPYVSYTSIDSGFGNWLSQNSGVIYPAILAVVYALVRLHTQFLGPLTWRGQAIQFLVNLPSLAFLGYVYIKSRSETTYSY